ncbi:MAG: glycerophosphoryl diester phosphodiesterase [Actinomycetota bacterium]|nr:glycerophosphoryl diester phosphodiesterase [Actinomycetota bacterium]
MARYYRLPPRYGLGGGGSEGSDQDEGIESLRHPPIAFAHRGGRAHAPENTLEAFRLALRLGATGLESDVWLTADGIPVLDHDGLVRVGRLGRLRSVPIAALPRSGLPVHVPTLAELYAECGTGFELSLDANGHDVAQAVVAAARAAGDGAHERLWICHPDWQLLAGWRKDPAFDGVHLVDSTRRRDMRQGPERRAAQLAESGIDAVNLHYTDCTAGLAALFHRFDRYIFGWDAQHERIIRDLVRMGIDGVFGDHVDRLVDAMGLVP